MIDFDAFTERIRALLTRHTYKGTQMRTQLFVFRAGIHVASVALAEFSADTKPDVLASAFMLVPALAGDEIIFASDSWMSQESTEDFDLFDVRPPSLNPHRLDALHICYATRDDPTNLTVAAYPYIKDSKHQMYWLECDALGSNVYHGNEAEGFIPTLLTTALTQDPSDHADPERVVEWLRSCGHIIELL